MSQSQSFDPSNSTEVNSEEAAQVVSGGTLPDVNPLVFEASTLDGNSVIDLSMLNSLEPSQSLDSYFGNDVSEKSDVDVCESENVGNLPSVDVPESLNSHGTADRVAKEVPEPLDEELAEKAVEQTAEVAAEISFDSASPIGQEDSHAENFEPEVDLDDLFASDETEDITPEKIVVKHSPDPNPVDKSELVEPKSELVEPKSEMVEPKTELVEPELAASEPVETESANLESSDSSISSGSVPSEMMPALGIESEEAKKDGLSHLEVIKVSTTKKNKAKPESEKKVEVQPQTESTPVVAEVSEIDALIAIADNDFPVVDEETVEENQFANLGLSKKLVAALDKSGYKTPTPIQAQTIPSLLAGRDVLGQAQTGTGKTAAFALPILDRIDTKQKRPQVLVLAPTRELAIQVAESFEKYASCIGGLRVAAIYGGQDYQVQINKLQRGAQVIVGTPGRVLDHMRRKTLQLGKLDALVLDEADEMLRMGFAEDVDAVLEAMPEERQMALFSATMPPKIREIAQTHLKDPVEVTIQKKTTTAETIIQRYIVASPHQKKAALVRIMEAEPVDGAIVFVKMRSTTEPLANELANHGFKTAALNGDVPQKQREKIIESLKNGKIDIIIATDVAARGLDVQRISHVINYDLPHDDEAYVHRIGRTGRAGREGNAILFLHPRERYVLTQLEKATRKKIDAMELPSNRDINKQRVSRFHEMITKALGHKDLSKFVSLIEQYQTDTDVPVEKIAAALGIIANAGKPLFQNDELKLSGFSEGRRDNGARNDRGRNDRGRNSRGRNDTFRTSEERQERKNARTFSGKTTTYRLDVGRQHGVQVGNIVGAIANEAGIDNSEIGKIKIFDRFTSIDLPQSMGGDAIEHLKKVVVKGRPLNIAQMQSSESKDSPRPASRGGYGGGGYQGGGSNGGGSGKRPFKKPFKKTSYESKPRGRNNS
jgi:ATP-dependent RNA helicase DeaD